MASSRNGGAVLKCRKWAGSFRRDGYGQMFVDGKNWAAHRLEYFRRYGAIPDGMCVMHSCDNRWCVEISHLSLGTKAENTADMVRKGRAGGAKGSRHYKAKLSESDIPKIRSMLGKSSTYKMAVVYGVDPKTIHRIWNGTGWTHVK